MIKEGEVFNLDTMAVEKVEPKVEEPKAEEKVPEVEVKKEEEKKEEETPKDTPAEEPKAEEEPLEPAPDEEPADEPVKVENKPNDKEPVDEPKDEEPVSIDDFLKNKYDEKYEIKSEKDLDAILENVNGLVEVNETLDAEVKELKAKLEKTSDKPKFKSAAQESLWEFVKDIDPARAGDGIQTWSRLVGMDVDKEPAKLLLEEQFILENPDLGREDASKKFNRDFNKKYGEPVRENFETDADFEEEKDARRIDMKADVSKAKKYLLEKQKEYKKEQPKTEEEKPVVNEVVNSAIKKNTAALETNMKSFTELILSPTDKKGDDFHYKLTKEQQGAVHEAMKPWVSSPGAYDQNGKFVGGDLMENVTKAAFMLFGPEITELAYKSGLSKGELKKADELAKRQPDRKAKAAGTDPIGNLTEEQQIEMAIRKKKAERASRPMVAR